MYWTPVDPINDGVVVKNGTWFVGSDCIFRNKLMSCIAPLKVIILDELPCEFHALIIIVSPSAPVTATEYFPVKGPIPVWPVLKNPEFVSFIEKKVPASAWLESESFSMYPSIPCGIGIES